jgi:hypothetical protein
MLQAARRPNRRGIPCSSSVSLLSHNVEARRPSLLMPDDEKVPLIKNPENSENEVIATVIRSFPLLSLARSDSLFLSLQQNSHPTTRASTMSIMATPFTKVLREIQPNNISGSIPEAFDRCSKKARLISPQMEAANLAPDEAPAVSSIYSEHHNSLIIVGKSQPTISSTPTSSLLKNLNHADAVVRLSSSAASICPSNTTLPFCTTPATYNERLSMSMTAETTPCSSLKDTSLPLPVRVWQMVSDLTLSNPKILRWDEDDKSFLVAPDKTLAEVMESYGFPSIFKSFRRQLNHFGWSVYQTKSVRSARAWSAPRLIPVTLSLTIATPPPTIQQ